MTNITPKHPRPLSPNIQHYRPQLTSVLSIVNRITGVALSGFALLLVVWLIAGALGPEPYSSVQRITGSWAGQAFLYGCAFAFYLHLFGGIRHLFWDMGYGFELRSIYISGWAVVAASVTFTAATWVARTLIEG